MAIGEAHVPNDNTKTDPKTDTKTDIKELPYNPVNKVIHLADITRIFRQYGLEHPPKDVDKYRLAMVHPSYCTHKNENAEDGNTNCPDNCLPLQEESYERLEFLGDTVIATIIGHYLFDRFPERENEGFLTKMRTKLVNGIMLSHLCGFTDIPDYIIISHQIESNKGRKNRKILEDVFEAFIGAMYKDFIVQAEEDPRINALALCETWLINLIEENVDFSKLILANTNYKDQLLKHFTMHHGYVPNYFEINNETTAQGKRYDVCIKDNMQAIIAIGSGPSKKQAENDAAYNALVKFNLL